MYYAQLTQGVVTGVTQTSGPLPESPDLVALASYDIALLGWTYDGSTFSAPAPVSLKRHISVGAFYDRFGAEKWAILADASPSVQAVIKDASVRAYIDLDNPQLPMGLQILITAGHTLDAAAIIGAAIDPAELP